MGYYQERMAGFGFPGIPAYSSHDFGRMLKEEEVDTVLVTTMDCTHHDYIIQALEAGVDVISEKPLTTDVEKCRAILDAVKRTGGSCRVAFNYRWINWNTKVKELLLSGIIGNVKLVHLEYLLDTRHGADYYRRWHSQMKNSSGLLVHKSTHHFDLVNWWVDSIPQSVFASGNLFFYGRKNAEARGDHDLTRYPRYTGYAEAQRDPFALDLSKEEPLRRLYLDAENETGYIRDQNVFRDGIDIYDGMSVNVRYRSGVLLNYSLVSFSPREGMRVSFNGDRGRIEYTEFGSSHIIKGQDDTQLGQDQQSPDNEMKIRVFPHFAAPYNVVPDPAPEGGHYGSDVLLGEQFFSAAPSVDPFGRGAGHEQGAASILIGIAANRSIQEERAVNISDLVSLKPDAVRLSELT